MRFDPSIVTVGFCNSKPFLQLFREFDYWSLNRGWPLNRWPLYGGCLDLARRIGWEYVFDKTSKWPQGQSAEASSCLQEIWRPIWCNSSGRKPQNRVAFRRTKRDTDPTNNSWRAYWNNESITLFTQLRLIQYLFNGCYLVTWPIIADHLLHFCVFIVGCVNRNEKSQ